MRTADDVGFDSIWVMDHFFQIRSVGKPTEPMLEGWTTLGWIAANTRRARLGLMVGGVPYRYPAVWVKAATTLDVLSGGPGVARDRRGLERRGGGDLGIPFPPLVERFELLEETLAIAHAMWAGERGSEGRFQGRHVRATRLLNSPQSLSRPRIPIMIGGGGSGKRSGWWRATPMRRNVFGAPEAIAPQVPRPRTALRGRRPRLRGDRADHPPVGRDLSDGGDGTRDAAEVVDRLGELNRGRRPARDLQRAERRRARRSS